MEFADVVSRRHMVRDFDPTRAVSSTQVDDLVAAACRAPSAGNSQGWDFVVLEGPAQTSQFWDVSLPAVRRASFGWPGLLDAPVLLCPVANPGAYVARYAEPDKAPSGLGAGPEAWSFPYWLTDTAFATMVLLLAATDAGLGACFFGLFERAQAVARALGIPADRIPLGMVALGHPRPGPHRRGRSAGRPRRSVDDVVHRGGW